MCVNHKVVQRIMQKYGWQCRVKVKKRKRTGQPYAIAANLLNRDFEATAPLQKLVTDITYLPFGQKQLYLSSIQDLYNGEIIAYSIGDCQDTDFVLDTLAQLHHFPEGCTLHSDQGAVYTSYDYQQAVKAKGITMSMSRKGTPADNAPIESFHSVLSLILLHSVLAAISLSLSFLLPHQSPFSPVVFFVFFWFGGVWGPVFFFFFFPFFFFFCVLGVVGVGGFFGLCLVVGGVKMDTIICYKMHDPRSKNISYKIK
ncbi:hypothetical protein LSPH24S_04992 [Lysinibacillus sphaericus]